MFVLRQEAKSGFLYYVENGPMGFPKITSDIREAKQFENHGEAEEALTLVAQTFEIFEV